MWRYQRVSENLKKPIKWELKITWKLLEDDLRRNQSSLIKIGGAIKSFELFRRKKIKKSKKKNSLFTRIEIFYKISEYYIWTVLFIKIE